MKDRLKNKNSTKRPVAIRKRKANAVRCAVAMLLSFVLCLMGVPISALSAAAAEGTSSNENTPSNSSSLASNKDNSTSGREVGNSEDSSNSTTSNEVDSSEPGSSNSNNVIDDVAVSEEADKEKTLETVIDDVDGNYYVVKVIYNKDAKIPDGTKLSVKKILPELTKEEKEDPANKDRPYDVERFVGKDTLEDWNSAIARTFDPQDDVDDYIYFTETFQIVLESNGSRVSPDVPVEVTVETTAIAPSLSDGIEAVTLTTDLDKFDESAQLSAIEEKRVTKGDKVPLVRETENLTGDKDAETHKSSAEEKRSKISFKTDEFGEISLVGISVPLFKQGLDDETTVSILGPASMSADLFEIGISNSSEFGDGIQLLAAFAAAMDPHREYDTTLWAALPKSDSETIEVDKIAACAIDDEGAAGKPQSLVKPVAFSAENGIAFVRSLTKDSSTENKEGSEPAEGTDIEGAGIIAPAVESGTADGQEGANKTAVEPEKKELPEIAEEDAVVLSSSLKSITGTAYDVTVTFDSKSGIKPDCVLKVRELTGIESKLYAKQIDQTVNGQDLTYLRLFDITILDQQGNEVEPATPGIMSIALANVPQLDSANVIHFNGKDTDVIAPEVTPVLSGAAFDFEVESFSVYAVAGYTVDFHWNERVYNMAGEDSIYLSELFEELEVTEITIADVSKVTFSDPSLLRVTKVEGESGTDWLLTSLKPFDTEEALTLTLQNGRRVPVLVTDEGELPSGTWAGQGTGAGGTWSIDANGTFTLEGTGKMANYGGVTSTPWSAYRNTTTPYIRKLVVGDDITYLANNILTRSKYFEEIDASNGSLSGKQGTDMFKVTAQEGLSQNSSVLKRVDLSGNPELNGFGQNAWQNCKVIEYLDISDTAIPNSFMTNNATNGGITDCKPKLATLKANDCPEFKTPDLSGYTKLQTIELKGCTNLTSLKLNSNLTVPLSLYVSNTFTRQNLAQYQDSNLLTIYFDGSYSEWINNGFTYDNGKWGNVNVIFTVAVQITNDDGILYYNDGTRYCPASFKTIKEAYDELDNLYVRDGNDYTPNGDNPVNVELLKDEYEIGSTDVFSWANTVPVTLTSGANVDQCTIKPASDLQEDYLFTVNGGIVATENIVIDGNDAKGAINVLDGDLTLKQDSRIQNALTTNNAGTVNLSGDAALTIQDNAEIADSNLAVSTADTTQITMSDNASIADCDEAIYLVDYAQLTLQDNVSITGSHTAVYVGDGGVEVHFAGSPQVSENDQNVYVPDSIEDTSSIFLIDGELNQARIGIYIVSDTAGSSAQMGSVFATTTVSAASNDNLSCFVNDRVKDYNNSDLRGWPAIKGVAGDVIWTSLINVKFVEMDSEGNLTPLSSENDAVFVLDANNWSDSADMLTAIGLYNAPVVSGKCFFYYYGLGSSSASSVSDLGSYSGLSDFYLKSSTSGVLYSPDGTDPGVVVNGMDTVFMIYSQDEPEGSGTMLLRNVSDYSFSIDAIQIWDTPEEGEEPVETTASLILRDQAGYLSVCDSFSLDDKLATTATASVTILNAENKNFKILGRCISSSVPQDLEVEFSISNPSHSVYLMGSEIQNFPETGANVVGGELIDSDHAVSIVVSAQAPRAVHVSKTWVDNTVPEGADKSHGNTSIEVHFLDSEGYSVRVRGSINHEPGVTVGEDESTVVLSRVNGEWPESWKVYVPDNAAKVEETPVSGYIHTNGDIDSETGNASVSNERAICKIGDKLFASLNAALDYAVASGIGSPKIELLLDYTMPAADALKIPNGYHVTITTALEGDTDVYTGEGVATIKRGEDFISGYMFNNEYATGTLIFTDINLDGDSVESSKAMIANAGSLQILHGANGVTLKGANCTGNGGVIESMASNEAGVKLSGVTVIGNHAGNGGAIYVSGGDLEIEDSVIGGAGDDMNTATNGGAIFYAAPATLTIKDSTVSNNAAVLNSSNEGGNGGAIYASSGTIELVEGTELSSNIAVNGGAIYASAGVVRINDDSLVTNNEVSQDGGAIYAGTAEVDIATDDEAANCGILANVANRHGGAVYINTGTAIVSSGSIASNEAVNGGAIFVELGKVQMSGGTISQNQTSAGSSVFVDLGTATLNGGRITSNTSTDGGALGIGDNSVRLDFAGNIHIRGNFPSDSQEVECNVYLNKDTDAIINTAGMSEDANVGVYVPGPVTDPLFKNRGQVGASFGLFTGSENLDAFVNDRQTSLQAIGEADTGRILWSDTLQVQVRRLDSFAGGFPPQQTGYAIYPAMNNDDRYAEFYPPLSMNATSALGDYLYKNYKDRLTQTNAFAAAYVVDENLPYSSYADYITDVNWNSETGAWEGVKRDGTIVSFGTGENQKKLVIYYSEPAYINIENNNDQDLTLNIDSLVFPNLGASADLEGGYGFVVARNGVAQDALRPLTASDLILKNGETRKIMLPGGYNQRYEMSSHFTTAQGQVPTSPSSVSLIRTVNNGNQISDVDGIIPATNVASGFELGTANDLYPSAASAKTLSIKGGTHEIVFGDRKRICKIVTGDLTAPESSYSAKIPIGTTGRYEYLFSHISQAVSFGQNYMGQSSPIKVEMLVDYPIPSTDAANMSAGYKFTFTTALEGITEGENHYEGTGNATISRDTNNFTSFITVSGGMGSELRVDNLNFDGRNFSGSIDGGVISTKDCKVFVSHANFKNCRAANGGAIFVDYTIDENHATSDHVNYYYNIDGDTTEVDADSTNAVLDVSYSNFANCYSDVKLGGRRGGGAVHTTARSMLIDHCEFTGCETTDQGGGIFHRIDNKWDPTSKASVTYCNFTSCKAAAAGGVEIDSGAVVLDHCKFKHCSATNRNAGAANIYTMAVDDNVDPGYMTIGTVSYCDFEDCTVAITTQNNNGGALRTIAKMTNVNHCTFNDVSSKRGGAIACTNQYSISLVVNDCKIGEHGSASASNYGGGIYCEAEHLNVNNTLINNCSAGLVGGGIYHLETQTGTSTDISNSTIRHCRAEMGTGGSIKDLGGGGVYARTFTMTITGSEVSDCSSSGSGGGICFGQNNNTGRLILDGTTVKSSSTGKCGGGVYFNGEYVWLKNDSYIQGNKLTSDVQMDGAGLYMPGAGYKLVIGDEGRTTPDNTSVTGNTTASGNPSNFKMRMDRASGATRNPNNSVEVRSDLSGVVRVINPMVRGTQFGTSYVSEEINVPFPAGFSDLDHVFVSDDQSEEGMLYGIVDRVDVNGYKLIWAANPICKITDGNGTLLYLNHGVGDVLRPAVFDRLNDSTSAGSNGTYASAFNLLRHPALNDPNNPIMYYADGTPYTGNAYCVKMLVENYTATTPITTSHTGSIATGNGNIVFTTSNSEDPDRLFPYRGKPGTVSTIKAGNAIPTSLLTAKVNMTLENITLDGNANDSHFPRLIYMSDNNNFTVTLGRNTTLQNAHHKTDWAAGAGVRVDKGTLVLNGGTITNCQVESSTGNVANGGGVYVGTNGQLRIIDGQITRCSANKGGGVFVNNNRLEMSGGRISNNTAVESGGGIAVGTSNVVLYFSGEVYVTGNKGNGNKTCNLQLDYDKNTIIQCGNIVSGSIGVYVPDTNGLYEQHGALDTPFGTYDNSTNIHRLKIFVSDRDGYKGGMKTTNPGLIYWVKDFSLKVTKTVDSEWDSDKNAEFEFIVILSGRTTEGVPAESINGAYGEMYFTNGVATRFKLRHGQSRVATDLPEGLTYSVRENLTPTQASYFTTDPGIEQMGRIGENVNSDNPEIRYVSTTAFVNRHASGETKVILRKMSSNGDSLEGAVFTVYRGTSNAAYVAHEEVLAGLESSVSGVFWVGMLPYGTYYMQENQAPAGYGSNAGKWFCAIVDETGVYMSDEGEVSKEAAFRNASDVKTASQT